MKQKIFRQATYILTLLITFIIFIPLVYSTKPISCIDQYFLKDYKLLINTSLIKVEQSELHPSMIISDYDNFSEGMSQDEVGNKFNDKFIIKSVNNEGKENILNKSRFKLVREREKERYYAIDIGILPDPCEKGFNIYKKYTGELIYSSQFKLFYSACYEEAKELCPAKDLPKKVIIPENNLPIPKDTNTQHKNIFQKFLGWLLKIFYI